MAERNYWVLCDDNCRFPAMTKEQILTAIAQAVSTGKIGDIDTGFITTIKTINGTALRFFVGTQNEYEALSEDDKKSVFAIITNDTSKEGIEAAIKTLEDEINDLETAFKGKIIASGEWYVEDVVSQTNFIKPNTKYIVEVGDTLFEGISDAAGETIEFGKVTGGNECINASGGRIWFNGASVVFLSFDWVKITASGNQNVSGTSQMTLTRVIECISI